jgi:hypothetical protein
MLDATLFAFCLSQTTLDYAILVSYLSPFSIFIFHATEWKNEDLVRQECLQITNFKLLF